jgi:hypothetical protein
LLTLIPSRWPFVFASNQLEAVKFLLEKKAKVNAPVYFAKNFGPKHEFAKQPLHGSSELHYSALM